MAQTIEGTTGFCCAAKVAKPQSVPAITRSRPTMSAYWQIRCATRKKNHIAAGKWLARNMVLNGGREFEVGAAEGVEAMNER